MSIDSPEMTEIRTAVRDEGITILLGYSEREGASIYMAQTLIGPEGQVLMHRRKIKPTGVERALWGDGQGKSTRLLLLFGSFNLNYPQGDSAFNVAQTPVGKVGALNWYAGSLLCVQLHLHIS